MKRIAVSGASGFIGSNLLGYLEKNGIVAIPLDLRKSQSPQLSGFSAVVHLAGKAHDMRGHAGAPQYAEVNTALTKKIYDQFILSDSKVFIFLSSVKAAADHLSSPLTEEHLPDPRTWYGKSKLEAEKYIQSLSLPVGKRYYILRPCMIHGPRNKGNLNLLFNLLKKKLPWPLAAFHNRRSFCSVENLCYVIKEMIGRDDIPQGIYNVADDEAISTNELIKIMAQAMNRKPMLLSIPTSWMRLLAKLGDLFSLPLNTQRLTKLTESFEVDNTKIRQALGKSFPLTTYQGLFKTIQSFSNKR